MVFNDLRSLRYFDWISFTITVVLCSIGTFFVFSATYRAEIPFSLFLKKQLFGMATGFALYALCCMIDHRNMTRWCFLGYIATIAFLIFTLVKGSVGMGAQRWINLGFIRFQPSELAKLAFPAFLTHYLYSKKDTLRYTLRDYLPLLIILAISFLLILKQPDLGTALLVLFSGCTLLWLAGLSRSFFIWATLFLVISAPLSWHVLKPYQKKRIAVFLGQGDNKKERYHIEQSKIAIGSGGWLGKGFLCGTQNKLRFLPESRTDFIFSVLSEEWGFLGALAIILLYAFLFIRSLLLILSLRNFYTQLLATGLIIHIVFSTIINIGMVTGLLPIVGIPLPLLSYGITNVWITLASLGWFQGIVMQSAYRER